MNIPNLEDLYVDGLSIEKVREIYEESGVVIFDSGIEEGVIDGTVDFMVADFGQQLRGRKQDAWKRSRYVKDIALAPAVLEMLVQLYGRSPIPFQTLNFMMPTAQNSHSDEIHFSSFPHGLMCGVWIALEDINPDAGPLMFYPGSHKLPFLSIHDLGLPPRESSLLEYEDAIARTITHQGFGPKKTLGTIKKGEAIIWASNLIHGGSLPVDNTLTRLSQVTHYFFEGAEKYYTPLLSDPKNGKWTLRNVDALEIR